MKVLNILWFGFWIVALCSCEPKSNSVEINTLSNSLGYITNHNALQLNKIKYVIQEKGNREVDLKLYNDIVATLELKNPLTISSEFTDSTNTQAIIAYSNRLVVAGEQLMNQENDGKEILTLLNDSQHALIEHKAKKEYLIFLINLASLQQYLIMKVSDRIGARPIDFGGLANLYCQSDTLTRGDTLKAIIVLDYNFDDEALHLQKVWSKLTLNGTERNYKLDPVGKGAWSFSFIPEQSGIYQLDFSTVAMPLNYVTPWGLPFNLKRDFYVKE